MLGILEDFERYVGKPVGNVLGNRHENVRPVAVEVDAVDGNAVDDDGIDRAVGKRTLDGGVVTSLDEVRLAKMRNLQRETVGADVAAFRMEHVALGRFVVPGVRIIGNGVTILQGRGVAVSPGARLEFEGELVARNAFLRCHGTRGYG